MIAPSPRELSAGRTIPGKLPKITFAIASGAGNAQNNSVKAGQ
jgi:hypothetical protein